jgi:5'-3' exonuclease
MGIPGLYRNIIEKYENLHRSAKPLKNDRPITHFLVDFNPIIYNCHHALSKQRLDKGRTVSGEAYETELIKQIMNKTRDLVNEWVKPRKLLYIAIDGPAPRAKMVKQRERRFKKGIEKRILNDMRSDTDLSTDVEVWSTSKITPGTEFMYKLNEEFRSKIGSGWLGSKTDQIIFSGSDIAGEGEHKFLPLLQDLDSETFRKSRQNKKHPKPNVVIFSNDGDLMMLGQRFLSLNMRIMLNSQHSTQTFKELYAESEYCYVDVSQFQRAFLKELGMRDKKSIFDFIFYNMFAGNDFVQPFFFLKMRKRHTYKQLFFVYKKLHGYHKNSLIRFNRFKQVTINDVFLLDFIRELAQGEDFRLTKQFEFFCDFKPREEEEDDFFDHEPTEAEILTKKFEEFEHTYFFDEKHPNYVKCIDEFRKFMIYDGSNYVYDRLNFKQKYYEHFFGINSKSGNWITKVFNICYEYLRSLVFCINYYLYKCPSWKYYYPYRAAPLPSDLLYFMESRFYYDFRSVNELGVRMLRDKSRPYKPFEQLFLVMPRGKKNMPDQILPDQLTKMMDNPKISCMFDFDENGEIERVLDVVNGEKLIYAEPILPEIRDELALKIVRPVISNLNSKLNELSEEPFIKKFSRKYADTRRLKKKSNGALGRKNIRKRNRDGSKK